jgi:hypothetical protein
MPEPHTTPREHDKPVFQPGAPTPEDPRQREPIQDPPLDPEHDDVERINPVRQAEDIERGVGAKDPAPDTVVFDETRPVG